MLYRRKEFYCILITTSTKECGKTWGLLFRYHDHLFSLLNQEFFPHIRARKAEGREIYEFTLPYNPQECAQQTAPRESNFGTLYS